MTNELDGEPFDAPICNFDDTPTSITPTEIIGPGRNIIIDDTSTTTSSSTIAHTQPNSIIDINQLDGVPIETSSDLSSAYSSNTNETLTYTNPNQVNTSVYDAIDGVPLSDLSTCSSVIEHGYTLHHTPILNAIPSINDIDGVPMDSSDYTSCSNIRQDSQVITPISNTAPSPGTINTDILAAAPPSIFQSQLHARPSVDDFIHSARLQSDIPVSPPSSFSINCHQLNLHRSLAPLDNLQHLITNSTSDSPWICLLQEPPVNKSLNVTAVSNNFVVVASRDGTVRPRATIILSKFLDNCSTHLAQYTNRDLATVRIHTGPSTPDLILCSYYWDYNEVDIPQPLIQLCDFASSSNLALVLGGDANAHHTSWGSSKINKRGEKLMELIINKNLTILNDGSITFQNVLRCEALDITLGNPAALDLVSSWCTSSAPSLSDHSLISFKFHCSNNHLQRPSPSLHRSRKLFKTEESSFKDNLSDLLTKYSKSLSYACKV